MLVKKSINKILCIIIVLFISSGCTNSDSQKIEVKTDKPIKEYSCVPFKGIFKKEVKFRSHYNKIKDAINFEYDSSRDENLDLKLGVFRIEGQINKYPSTYCTLQFDDSCIVQATIFTDYTKISSAKLLKIQMDYIKFTPNTIITTEYFEEEELASFTMEAIQR